MEENPYESPQTSSQPASPAPPQAADVRRVKAIAIGFASAIATTLIGTAGIRAFIDDRPSPFEDVGLMVAGGLAFGILGCSLAIRLGS